MRFTVDGVSGRFDAIRDAIAQVVAGASVPLVEISRAALPDADGLGGTHHLVLEGLGVRVEETIESGQYGNPRDGYGYAMRWTFVGTGSREGASATIVAGGTEPKVLSFTMDVTDAEGPAMREALRRVLGRDPRVW
jgi:hypothetical protein